jgi:hypothetical protein
MSECCCFCRAICYEGFRTSSCCRCLYRQKETTFLADDLAVAHSFARSRTLCSSVLSRAWRKYDSSSDSMAMVRGRRDTLHLHESRPQSASPPPHLSHLFFLVSSHLPSIILFVNYENDSHLAHRQTRRGRLAGCMSLSMRDFDTPLNLPRFELSSWRVANIWYSLWHIAKMPADIPREMKIASQLSYPSARFPVASTDTAAAIDNVRSLSRAIEGNGSSA